MTDTDKLEVLVASLRRIPRRAKCLGKDDSAFNRERARAWNDALEVMDKIIAEVLA